MTEQEAIDGIKYIYKKCDTEYCKYRGKCDTCCEAIYMAISALEKQIKLNKLGFTEEVIENYKIFEDECISKGFTFRSLLDAREGQINGGWIPCSNRLPDELVPVNITWINRNPESYYAEIKDVPFTATGVYFDGKWYWDSCTCIDMLKEYGRSDFDIVDVNIYISAWKPLPAPYQESEVL